MVYSNKTRSPSSALLPFLFGGGSPTKIDYRKKVGTLILTSVLEDLENVVWISFRRIPKRVIHLKRQATHCSSGSEFTLLGHEAA